MNRILIITITTFLISNIFSQNNFVKINSSDTPEQIIEKAANVTPSERQYEWQKLELTGFIHFGINTYDEVEWGTHSTDITKFNPADIDVKQWVKVFKDAGYKLIILTAKHHDGFCLWPSKFTDYNISNTPFQNGEGDIVRDLSNACKEAEVKFGVYLSPWDMHEPAYGTPEYNTHFKNQLTELLTNYGEIAEVWFDGACGEGSNGKKQVYDWLSYYELIHKLQPQAVVAVMGNDVRWVGTESGYGRQTEWSVLPGFVNDKDEIAANSQQQESNGAFVPHDLMEEDLGSREKILTAKSLIWYPAEIDVSIRPGWFYNDNEDELVKSPQKLVDIFFNSVGLNGVLLLNIPPNKSGLIHSNDIKNLQGMKYILDETFKDNFALNSQIKATNELQGNESNYIVDNNPESYWTTNNDVSTASVEIKFTRGRSFNTLMLQENILKGQRIEKFRVDYWDGQIWRTFAKATTVGYKRLLRFPEVYSDRIKIVIEQCRTNPTLSNIGVYKMPPEISFKPYDAAFKDSLLVSITANSMGSKIYYTLDGSKPNEKSILYKDKILLTESTTINAIAISSDGKKSLPASSSFSKAKYQINYITKYNDKYPGSGLFTLVDGVKSIPNFNNGKWQGFNGNDMDVVVDLTEQKDISFIDIGFLNNINSYIFLPKSVEISLSQDGSDFSNPIIINNDLPLDSPDKQRKSFSNKFNNTTARFIRIVAKNIGICPNWHKGAGEKAWIFCDEIDIK
jgi:alpha-L-fucosidase